VGLRDAGVWLGLVEQDDEVLYDEDRDSGDTHADKERPPSAAPASGGVQIAVVSPRTFRDAHTIGEYFRQDVPVVINLHDLDAAAAKRIVDFASGLIFGRRGAIERLSGRVFLILPPGSVILKEREAVAGTEFFNQA
jgi:cell division inhibitor SepF